MQTMQRIVFTHPNRARPRPLSEPTHDPISAHLPSYEVSALVSFLTDAMLLQPALEALLFLAFSSRNSETAAVVRAHMLTELGAIMPQHVSQLSGKDVGSREGCIMQRV
jgi:hypothetical protein